MKIFLDSAKFADVQQWQASVAGFTTNPTLMAAAGVNDYFTVAMNLLTLVGPDKPVSFEVIADEFSEMERQARDLASFGRNVYVKIPITNTRGESSAPVIHTIATAGIKINVTAIMTAKQAQMAVEALRVEVPSILSYFAGRVADTGRDPVHILRTIVALARETRSEVLWASPREVLNVYQAERESCGIITLTPALLEKLTLKDKNLEEYSLDTVKMFYEDALKAGLTL